MGAKVRNLLFCIWIATATMLVTIAIPAGSIAGIEVILIVLCKGDIKRSVDALQFILRSDWFLAIIELISVLSGLVTAGLWYYIGYVRKNRLNNRKSGSNPKFWELRSVGFLISGCMACYLAGLVIDAVICDIFPEKAERLSELFDMTFGDFAVFELIVVVILGPVFEELVMRGLVVQRAKRTFGLWGCAVISALLFSAYHMNLIQAAYVLPMGFFLGIVAYVYDSLIPCIICHSLYNLISMVVDAVTDEQATVDVVSICAIAVIFAGLALMIACKCFSRREFGLPELSGIDDVEKRNKVLWIVCAVIVSLTTVATGSRIFSEIMSNEVIFDRNVNVIDKIREDTVSGDIIEDDGFKDERYNEQN